LFSVVLNKQYLKSNSKQRLECKNSSKQNQTIKQGTKFGFFVRTLDDTFGFNL